MAAWVWILSIVGAILVSVLLWLAVAKGHEASRTRNVRDGERLRLDAERKPAGAQQSERTAEQAAQTVTEERAEAERMRTEAQALEARG